MLSGPSVRSAFVCSINLLILSGFPLAPFHLVETSLSAFSWLYTLVCAVVQKFHELSFICNQKQPPEVFCEKGVLRNFAKFTGKHLCQRLFLNTGQGLQLY